MKRILLNFLLLGLTTSALWSQATMDFGVKTYDFGFVKEGDKAEYTFKFENNGNDSLKLTDVHASCGCTTPNWPRQPIADGESGEIFVSFNSQGRAGSFYKTITIENNISEESKQLDIRGYVVSSSYLLTDSIKKANADNTKNLVFDRSSINLGKAEQNKSQTVKIKVTNSGTKNVKMLTSGSGCSCVQLKETKDLKPSESAVLEFVYTPRFLGKRTEKFVIYTDDPENEVSLIEFNSEVVESLMGNKGLMDINAPKPFGF